MPIPLDLTPLGSGPIHWFADWPIGDVPVTGSAVYTVWNREGAFVWGQPWIHAGTLYATDGFGDDDDRKWATVTCKHLFSGGAGYAIHYEWEPKD